jgi:hypothetical protein
LVKAGLITTTEVRPFSVQQAGRSRRVRNRAGAMKKAELLQAHADSEDYGTGVGRSNSVSSTQGGERLLFELHWATRIGEIVSEAAPELAA